jgi:hypothetical protein
MPVTVLPNFKKEQLLFVTLDFKPCKRWSDCRKLWIERIDLVAARVVFPKAMLKKNMEQSPSLEANNYLASREISRLLWRLITVFTRTRHWSLSWARCIQSTLFHPVSLRSIRMSSSHLRLGLPTGLFSSSFSTKILYSFLSPPRVLHALMTFGEEYYKLRSSSLCSILQPPPPPSISSFFGQNILLRVPFLLKRSQSTFFFP